MSKFLDPNGSLINEIKDKDGNILFAYKKHFEVLDDLELLNAILEGIVCAGLTCYSTNFSGAIIRNCNFYWINAFMTNFSDTVMENCEFQGGDLKETKFVNATLKNCNFGTDNLGGSTDLSSADFTGATIIDCNFEKAKVNEETLNSNKVFEEIYFKQNHRDRWGAL